jgi:hypothetical protein
MTRRELLAAFSLLFTAPSVFTKYWRKVMADYSAWKVEMELAKILSLEITKEINKEIIRLIYKNAA